MGRSSDTSPRCTSTISPVAVIGLEMEASEYMVCAEAGVRASRLAHPNPSSQTIFPPLATATAMDGTPSSTSARWMRARARAKGADVDAAPWGAGRCAAAKSGTMHASARVASSAAAAREVSSSFMDVAGEG